jgi:hypothetical protein
MTNYTSDTPLFDTSVLRKYMKKGSYFVWVILLIFIISTGCATHKFKKHKPVPCPCEKENKH